MCWRGPCKLAARGMSMSKAGRCFALPAETAPGLLLQQLQHASLQLAPNWHGLDRALHSSCSGYHTSPRTPRGALRMHLDSLAHAPCALTHTTLPTAVLTAAAQSPACAAHAPAAAPACPLSPPHARLSLSRRLLAPLRLAPLPAQTPGAGRPGQIARTPPLPGPRTGWQGGRGCHTCRTA